jgi:hypothetical protein
MIRPELCLFAGLLWAAGVAEASEPPPFVASGSTSAYSNYADGAAANFGIGRDLPFALSGGDAFGGAGGSANAVYGARVAKRLSDTQIQLSAQSRTTASGSGMADSSITSSFSTMLTISGPDSSEPIDVALPVSIDWLTSFTGDTGEFGSFYESDLTLRTSAAESVTTGTYERGEDFVKTTGFFPTAGTAGSFSYLLEFSVTPNEPFPFFIGIESESVTQAWNAPNPSTVRTDIFLTFGEAPGDLTSSTAGMFLLPDGYTVDSAEGLIADNAYGVPTPGTATLACFGVLACVRRARAT